MEVYCIMKGCVYDLQGYFYSTCQLFWGTWYSAMCKWASSKLSFLIVKLTHKRSIDHRMVYVWDGYGG